MIINKSFKYDDEKRPKVHRWFQKLERQGKDYSEALRRLIEDRYEKDEQEIKAREQIHEDILSIRKMLSQMQGSGVRVESQNVDLLEIETLVDEIEKQPEIKVDVNIGQMKNRYGL